MLNRDDLLRLPFTPDLTEGGIAYACRSLASTSGRMGGFPLNHLRQVVAEVAVELAFRRYLSGQGIPFNVLGETPFTHPANYNVSLGGHRCDLESFLITRRSQISLFRRDPALLLQAPALLPLDQFAAEGHRPEDLYLFAFLLGLVADAHRDMDRATAAGHPTWLIHPMPGEWSCPPHWLPLENLVLKSECETPISMEIGGQDAGREFVTIRLELPPKKRLPVEQCFHSLAYVHADRQPEARIGLHSPRRGAAMIIPPNGWGNLWVYGMDIFLTGWLSHEEYRRKAKVLNTGMRTMQFERTGMKNLLVPLAELNPLRPLLAHVKEWDAAQKVVMERSILR
jgi:hypothetical protein